ncbi:MAG: hypothetical protein RIT28_4363 [Pseudomonadota bacterium]|jgi:hypothetical protein
MFLLLCSLPLAVAQEAAWVADTSVETAAAAWGEALRRRGLTVHPVSPIPNDHPALPSTLTLTFEGDAVIRARAVPTRGSVTLTRTGWEQVHAELVLDPPRTPPLAPKARARLALALPEEALVALSALEPTRPTLVADPLLADPGRCLARVAEFSASPIPEARETLRLALETAPKTCHRALLTSLLTDPAMKAPVSAWIVARYHAAPAEERAHYVALGFMIPEPDAALEAVYDAEDARLSGE